MCARNFDLARMYNILGITITAHSLITRYWSLFIGEHQQMVTDLWRRQQVPAAGTSPSQWLVPAIGWALFGSCTPTFLRAGD